LVHNEGGNFTPNPCSRQCETGNQEFPFPFSDLSQYNAPSSSGIGFARLPRLSGWQRQIVPRFAGQGQNGNADSKHFKKFICQFK
jgi:hypothetical protein